MSIFSSEFQQQQKKIKLFSDETLAHYGIQGQKWGLRRWQNADGTFNEAGKERYFGGKEYRFGLRKYQDADGNLTDEGKKMYEKYDLDPNKIYIGKDLSFNKDNKNLFADSLFGKDYYIKLVSNNVHSRNRGMAYSGTPEQIKLYKKLGFGYYKVPGFSIAKIRNFADIDKVIESGFFKNKDMAKNATVWVYNYNISNSKQNNKN